MHEVEAAPRNCGTLLSAAGELSAPAIASEQYPQGLGATVETLVRQLPVRPMAKVEFSCMQNDGPRQAVEAAGTHQVVVAGMEAHVCVLRTAFDLLRAGHGVFVVSDAVVSRQEASKNLALRRLEAEGATTVTTEMVISNGCGLPPRRPFAR
jgi:isochorismate hydrolase